MLSAIAIGEKLDWKEFPKQVILGVFEEHKNLCVMSCKRGGRDLTDLLYVVRGYKQSTIFFTKHNIFTIFLGR